MTNITEGLIDPANEQDFDFAGDSVVESKTLEWTITDAESVDKESDNGSGVQHDLTFENDEFPYPIHIRQFVSYTPTDSEKNTDWVKRSRGVLKNIAKAALGGTGYSFDPSSPNYIVGKHVTATTK